MRIKEEFKRSGDFWLPSLPDRRVPGTLSISDGGNIELEIDGVLTNEIEVLLRDGLEPIERIAGHIEKDGLVTLDDCYYRTGTINLTGGRSKSFIHVGRAFTGVIYDEGETPRFNTLTFSVEGIDEWVGISGINVERRLEERTANISYQPPEDISLNLGNGMQLLITFHWTLPGSPIIKEAQITQKTYFKLVSQEARELEDFASVVRKITTLLCFAIDKTVSLDSMMATADNLRQDFGSDQTRLVPVNIYYSSRPYSQDEPKIHQHDMVFGFGRIQNDAERKINNWMEVYERIDPTFDLYFSAQMDAQSYSDVRFLTLAHGLEVYHRRKSDEKRMNETKFEELVEYLINQCPPEDKDWLTGRLGYGNELTLRNRIKRIIEPFKDIIGNQQSPGTLINRIVDARNYLTHYNSALESAAEPENLALLCFKMELFFQLHFLQLIGFSRGEIDSIVANCRRLQWKRDLQF